MPDSTGNLQDICANCLRPLPGKHRPEKRWCNPSCRNAFNYAKKYVARRGLSAEGFERLRLAQDGKCLLCDRKKDKLVVDHCHEKGYVRGLLCVGCNLLLGLIEKAGINGCDIDAYLMVPKHVEKGCVSSNNPEIDDLFDSVGGRRWKN